jgi:hypothetical protein
LVEAASPTLETEEHVQLEQSLLGLNDPLDPDRSVEIRRALIARLAPDRVQTAEALEIVQEIRAEGGGPPAIPEFFEPTGGFIQGDRLSERVAQNHGLSSEDHRELLSSLDSLESDLEQSRSNSEDERKAALGRLQTSLPSTHALVMSAGEDLTLAGYEIIFNFLVNSAEALASDPEVLPDTEIGALVLALLVVGSG